MNSSYDIRFGATNKEREHGTLRIAGSYEAIQYHLALDKQKMGAIERLANVAGYTELQA